MIAVWYPTQLFGGSAGAVDLSEILLVTVLFVAAILCILTRQKRARPWPHEPGHFPDTGSIEQRWTGRG